MDRRIAGPHETKATAQGNRKYSYLGPSQSGKAQKSHPRRPSRRIASLAKPHRVPEQEMVTKALPGQLRSGCQGDPCECETPALASGFHRTWRSENCRLQ